MAQSWTEPLVHLVTQRLALLSDPTRVQLLVLLEQREQSVQELSDAVITTPQNVSRHLGILYRSGIVARRRDGTSVYYSLADYSACRLLEQGLASVRGQLDELADLVNLAA